MDGALVHLKSFNFHHKNVNYAEVCQQSQLKAVLHNVEKTDENESGKVSSQIGPRVSKFGR